MHYNVSSGGVLVDPFAALPHESGAASLWRAPMPTPGHPEAPAADDAAFTPTVFDPDRVAALLADLKHPERRAHIAAIADPYRRAWELVIETFTYPARFSSPAAGTALFVCVTRRSALDLPFSAEHFDDAVFADDVALRHAPPRTR